MGGEAGEGVEEMDLDSDEVYLICLFTVSFCSSSRNMMYVMVLHIQCQEPHHP